MDAYAVHPGDLPVFASIGAGMAFPYVALSRQAQRWCASSKTGENGWRISSTLGHPSPLRRGLFPDGTCLKQGGKRRVFHQHRFCRGYFFRAMRRWGHRCRLCNCRLHAAAMAEAGFLSVVRVIYKITSTRAALRSRPRMISSGGIFSETPSGRACQRAACDRGFYCQLCLNCQSNMMTVLSFKGSPRLHREEGHSGAQSDVTWTNLQAESLLHHLGSRQRAVLAVFRATNPYHPSSCGTSSIRARFVKVLKKLRDK